MNGAIATRAPFENEEFVEALPGAPRRRQESSALFFSRQPDDRDGSPIPRPSHVGWTPASGLSLRIAAGPSRSRCGRSKSLDKPNPECDRCGSCSALDAPFAQVQLL